MLISNNSEPDKSEFISLIDATITALEFEAEKDNARYLGLLGNKLEDVVADIMKYHAKNTPFEGTIELVSGLKFPDIVAKSYYGVEVKTTKNNHWTTIGNSVLESTRVDGVERIFMLFGKMINPIKFKCRPYEECLSSVVVTHSPRYFINMDLEKGQTIFDKLDLPYDELRRLNNPIKPITDYYRQFLKPGEEIWWLDQDEPKSANIIIQLWNNLSIAQRKHYMLKAMILFPEIFSNRPDKFNRVAVWLVNSESVVCPNIRDVFTAGGQGTVFFNNEIFSNIPQIVVKLTNSIEEIKDLLLSIDKYELELFWQMPVNDKFHDWIGLVSKNVREYGNFNLVNYLNVKLFCIDC